MEAAGFRRRMDNASLSPEADDTITYRQRPHAMAPEVEFGIANGLVSWADTKNRSGTLRLSKISDLRILYDPSRLIMPRWIVDIYVAGQEELRFTSTTLVGGGGFRSRNQAFLAFLAALHAAIAREAPQARCRFGPSWPGYIVRLVFWWLPVFAMAWGTYLGFTTSISAAGVFFGFITLYAAQFAARYSYYNWPRRYASNAPPVSLLPQPTPRDV